MQTKSDAVKPRWLRDLARFLPLKSQFVLSGNVRDLQIAPSGEGGHAPVPLVHALHVELAAHGYEATLYYDLVSGFRAFGTSEAEVAAGRNVLEKLGLTLDPAGHAPAGPALLMEVFGRFVGLDGRPVALVIDFASRLLVRADPPSEAEQRLFTHALVHAHRANARLSGITALRGARPAPSRTMIGVTSAPTPKLDRGGVDASQHGGGVFVEALAQARGRRHAAQSERRHEKGILEVTMSVSDCTISKRRMPSPAE